MKKKEILSCRNLCTSSRNGLNHFQMELYESERLLILGNCASGKEVLGELLAGQTTQYEGNFFWMEEKISPKKLKEIIESHEIFYASPDEVLIDNCSIEENIYVIRNRKGKNIIMPSKRARIIQTANLLQEFGLFLEAHMLIRDLNFFERLLVCLIKAASYDSRVILLKFPDDVLQQKELTELKNILAKLNRRGTAFIFLAEKYDNMRELCDRVILMSDGRDKKTATAEKLVKEEIPYYWLGEAYRKNRFSAAGAKKADILPEEEGRRDERKKNILGIFDKDWGSRDGKPEEIKKLFWNNLKKVEPYFPIISELLEPEHFGKREYLFVENREYDKLLSDIPLSHNLMLCRNIREACGYIHKSRESILEKEFYKQFPFLVERGRQYSDYFFYRLVAISRLERFHQGLLILDNPFVRLDVAEEEYMREYLWHLSKRKKLILISHRLQEIDRTAGTVLYVEDGNIVQIHQTM